MAIRDAPGSYWTALLASEGRPFQPRGGIFRLVGLPASSGEVSFSRRLPPLGVNYLHPNTPGGDPADELPHLDPARREGHQALGGRESAQAASRATSVDGREYPSVSPHENRSPAGASSTEGMAPAVDESGRAGAGNAQKHSGRDASVPKASPPDRAVSLHVPGKDGRTIARPKEPQDQGSVLNLDVRDHVRPDHVHDDDHDDDDARDTATPDPRGSDAATKGRVRSASGSDEHVSARDASRTPLASTRGADGRVAPKGVTDGRGRVDAEEFARGRDPALGGVAGGQRRDHGDQRASPRHSSPDSRSTAGAFGSSGRGSAVDHPYHGRASAPASGGPPEGTRGAFANRKRSPIHPPSETRRRATEPPSGFTTLQPALPPAMPRRQRTPSNQGAEAESAERTTRRGHDDVRQEVRQAASHSAPPPVVGPVSRAARVTPAVPRSLRKSSVLRSIHLRPLR